ncbi:chromosomal replication initiator protein DnaA [Candidatus Uhrbacteria bacterium]|nr:chromosomal replication initiator protein DnaA [Candidatus Uhrbacteria bacterium]
MMNHAQLWQAALAELELLVSRANFSTWFKDTSIASYEDARVVIRVPNAFTQAWLEKKYHPAIIKAISNITQEHVKEIIYKIEVVRGGVHETASMGLAPKTIAAFQQPAPIIGSLSNSRFENLPNGINKKYTFDSYIVGKANELAHAACLSVATNPGKTYNPLFIYGGVGLGKTHLLHALGNKAGEQNPNLKTLYVTCERFTNDYIHCIRNGRGKEFNDLYRGLDILMVDDIQFLTGKEGTQDAFFHTFNELHRENRQIVISSDRPPKAIAALEARLLSRFEWGMIADISQPDLETRIAILETKCLEHGIRLDHTILTYISQTIQNNIRELEGALNRLVAYRDLNHTELNMENVRSILSSLTSNAHQRVGGTGAQPLNIRNLMSTVATYYDLTMDDLLGKSRMKRLALPRQIMMYLMRQEIKSSFPTIGQEVGGRDHTTAIHAFEKISREVQDNEKIRTDIELIKQRLYSLALSG